MPTREWLTERNARWAALRAAAEVAGPGDPAFETALSALSQWTRWDRTRILAGLGWTASGPQEHP